MLNSTNSGRVIIIIIIMIVLMMLLTPVPEIHLTTAFGQESYLSNRPPSSSSFLSQDQKSNSMIADYSLSSLTGLNGDSDIGSSSSVSSGYSNINNNNNSKLVILNFDDGFQNQYTYVKPILDKY